MIKRLSFAVDRLSLGCAWVSSLGLVALVILTAVNVVMRYLFDSPIYGSHDLMQMILLAVVFLGIAFCATQNGHVAMDMIHRHLPPLLRRLVDTLGHLLTAAVIGLLAWRAGVNAAEAFEFGDSTNLIDLPFGPFLIVMAFGAALYAAVALLRVIELWTPGGAASPGHMDDL